MHIAASNPLALESSLIDKEILDKEQKLVTEELKNLGKSEDIAKKIYRYFCESFHDGTFVRKITGPDDISQLIPAGNSAMVE